MFVGKKVCSLLVVLAMLSLFFGFSPFNSSHAAEASDSIIPAELVIWENEDLAESSGLRAVAAAETGEGDYVVALAGGNEGSGPVTLIKMQQHFGLELWRTSLSVAIGHTSGAEDRHTINRITVISDGNILLAGSLQQYLGGSPGNASSWAKRYGFLIKIDSQTGEVLWERKYSTGGVAHDIFDVIETDTAYVFAGGVTPGSYDWSAEYYSVVEGVYKDTGLTAFSLAEEEARIGSIVAFNTVLETSDGGFIAAGHTNSQQAPNYREDNERATTQTDILHKTADGYVAKYAPPSGGVIALQWDSAYGTIRGDTLTHVLEVDDGYILGAGYEQRYGTSSPYEINGTVLNRKGHGDDIILQKINLTGTSQWIRNYGSNYFNDWLYSMEASPAGAVSFVAHAAADYSHQLPGADVVDPCSYKNLWLVTLENGSAPGIHSQKCIGYTQDYFLPYPPSRTNSVIPTSDGALLITGQNSSASKPWVAKVARETGTAADLSLDLEMEEIVLPGGGPGMLAPVQVANLGPADPAGARVELVFTPGEAVRDIAVEAPEGDGVTVDGNTVIWLLNGITQVETKSALVTVEVDEDFHGEIEVQGTVQAEGATDPNPDNSSSSAACDANPLADLLAGLINTPTGSGGWEHWIYVENLGPTGAKNVSISYTLPGALEFLSAYPEGYTYDADTGVISWNADYLGSGIRLEDTYMVTTGTGGGYVPGMVLSGLVTVTADTPDPDPDNNETEVSFGGEYDCYLDADSSILFYLDEFTPSIIIVNNGSAPFRPELTVTLPDGIEMVEEIQVHDAKSDEVLGTMSAAGDGHFIWSGSGMLESANALRAHGEFRVTEWNEDQNYDFSLSAGLRGYDAAGGLQLVRNSTKEQTVARPDLGFESREFTRVLLPEEQQQIEVVVATSVSDTYNFNTRGRAKVTMEIDGLSDKVSVLSVTGAVNDGDPSPVQLGGNKWEWLLPEGLIMTLDKKIVIFQAGPFAKGEGTEDVTIRLQVNYEPGEFDYSAHEKNTANDTGTILLHLQQNAVPEASLLTRASFWYDESTKNVLQTYTTSYAFKNTDKIKRFVIEENYTYLDSLSDFGMMGRPELIEGITGTLVNYSQPSGTTPCTKGAYAAKIETPAGKFRFWEDLILNTRVRVDYEADDGSTKTIYQYFSHTFRFDAPAPKITTPVSGEMLDVNNGFLVAGWALPNSPVHLLRAGSEQLLATVLSDENGAFFVTVPASMAPGDAISFYAVVVSPGSWAMSSPSKTVSLTESSRCWCPQRSTWSGSDTHGNKYTYSFRSAETGLPSAGDWQVPGVYGFWDTILKLYTCPNPTEVWVIADGAKYEPEGRDGRYFIFHLGQAHNVTIHVTCEECEKPAESGGVVLIDPDGFVYDVSEGWGNVVPGAKVTCMEYDPDTDSWSEWPAHLDIYENQVNPQIVGDDGYFAFFTPPGRYYILVENPDPYQSWRSPDLIVVAEIVHRNVPYTPLPEGEPAITVYASTDGLCDENGLSLAQVTINQGENVQWISEAPDEATVEELLDLTENPVIRIESLIDPEADNRGFDSGMLAPLAAYSCRFAYSGDYEYCYLQGDEARKGKIIVRGAAPADGGRSGGDSSQTPTPAVTPGIITPKEMKIIEQTAQYTRLIIPDDLLQTQIDFGQKNLEINLEDIDNTIIIEFSKEQLALILEKLSEIKLLTGYGQLTIPAGSYPQGEKLDLSLGRYSQNALLPAGARRIMETAEFTTGRKFLRPATISLSCAASNIGADEEIFVFASNSPWRPLYVNPHDDTFELEITDSTKYLLAAVKTGFEDAAGHWARRDIVLLSLQGIVSGVSKEKFEPDREITRAEFAAILARALGLKSARGENTFSDVKDTDWYYESVQTAYEYGIISGYGNGKFGPADKITREQVMTMLARTTSITGLKMELEAREAEKLLATFEDAAHAAAWAKDSLAACVKIGLLQGKDDKTLAPGDETTRAEVVVVIRRLLELSSKISSKSSC